MPIVWTLWLLGAGTAKSATNASIDLRKGEHDLCVAYARSDLAAGGTAYKLLLNALPRAAYDRGDLKFCADFKIAEKLRAFYALNCALDLSDDCCPETKGLEWKELFKKAATGDQNAKKVLQSFDAGRLKAAAQAAHKLETYRWDTPDGRCVPGGRATGYAKLYSERAAQARGMESQRWLLLESQTRARESANRMAGALQKNVPTDSKRFTASSRAFYDAWRPLKETPPHPNRLFESLGPLLAHTAFVAQGPDRAQQLTSILSLLRDYPFWGEALEPENIKDFQILILRLEFVRARSGRIAEGQPTFDQKLASLLRPRISFPLNGGKVSDDLAPQLSLVALLAQLNKKHFPDTASWALAQINRLADADAYTRASDPKTKLKKGETRVTRFTPAKAGGVDGFSVTYADGRTEFSAFDRSILIRSRGDTTEIFTPNSYKRTDAGREIARWRPTASGQEIWLNGRVFNARADDILDISPDGKYVFVYHAKDLRSPGSARKIKPYRYIDDAGVDVDQSIKGAPRINDRRDVGAGFGRASSFIAIEPGDLLKDPNILQRVRNDISRNRRDEILPRSALPHFLAFVSWFTNHIDSHPRIILKAGYLRLMTENQGEWIMTRLHAGTATGYHFYQSNHKPMQDFVFYKQYSGNRWKLDAVEPLTAEISPTWFDRGIEGLGKVVDVVLSPPQTAFYGAQGSAQLAIGSIVSRLGGGGMRDFGCLQAFFGYYTYKQASFNRYAAELSSQEVAQQMRQAYGEALIAAGRPQCDRPINDYLKMEAGRDRKSSTPEAQAVFDGNASFGLDELAQAAWAHMGLANMTGELARAGARAAVEDGEGIQSAFLMGVAGVSEYLMLHAQGAAAGEYLKLVRNPYISQALNIGMLLPGGVGIVAATRDTFMAPDAEGVVQSAAQLTNSTFGFLGLATGIVSSRAKAKAMAQFMEAMKASSWNTTHYTVGPGAHAVESFGHRGSGTTLWAAPPPPAPPPSARPQPSDRRDEAPRAPEPPSPRSEDAPRRPAPARPEKPKNEGKPWGRLQVAAAPDAADGQGPLNRAVLNLFKERMGKGAGASRPDLINMVLAFLHDLRIVRPERPIGEEDIVMALSALLGDHFFERPDFKTLMADVKRLLEKAPTQDPRRAKLNAWLLFIARVKDLDLPTKLRELAKLLEEQNESSPENIRALAIKIGLDPNGADSKAIAAMVRDAFMTRARALEDPAAKIKALVQFFVDWDISSMNTLEEIANRIGLTEKEVLRAAWNAFISRAGTMKDPAAKIESLAQFIHHWKIESRGILEELGKNIGLDNDGLLAAVRKELVRRAQLLGPRERLDAFNRYVRIWNANSPEAIADLGKQLSLSRPDITRVIDAVAPVAPVTAPRENVQPPTKLPGPKPAQQAYPHDKAAATPATKEAVPTSSKPPKPPPLEGAPADVPAPRKGLELPVNFDPKRDLYRAQQRSDAENPIDWAKYDHPNRQVRELANRVFGNLPEKVTRRALLKIHNLGGDPKTLLARKLRALRELGCTPDQASLILRLGICGDAPGPPPAPKAAPPAPDVATTRSELPKQSSEVDGLMATWKQEFPYEWQITTPSFLNFLLGRSESLATNDIVQLAQRLGLDIPNQMVEKLVLARRLFMGSRVPSTPDEIQVEALLKFFDQEGFDAIKVAEFLSFLEYDGRLAAFDYRTRLDIEERYRASRHKASEPAPEPAPVNVLEHAWQQRAAIFRWDFSQFILKYPEPLTAKDIEELAQHAGLPPDAARLRKLFVERELLTLLPHLPQTAAEFPFEALFKFFDQQHLDPEQIRSILFDLDYHGLASISLNIRDEIGDRYSAWRSRSFHLPANKTISFLVGTGPSARGIEIRRLPRGYVEIRGKKTQRVHVGEDGVAALTIDGVPGELFIAAVDREGNGITIRNTLDLSVRVQEPGQSKSRPFNESGQPTEYKPGKPLPQQSTASPELHAFEATLKDPDGGKRNPTAKDFEDFFQARDLDPDQARALMEAYGTDPLSPPDTIISEETASRIKVFDFWLRSWMSKAKPQPLVKDQIRLLSVAARYECPGNTTLVFFVNNVHIKVTVLPNGKFSVIGPDYSHVMGSGAITIYSTKKGVSIGNGAHEDKALTLDLRQNTITARRYKAYSDISSLAPSKELVEGPGVTGRIAVNSPHANVTYNVDPHSPPLQTLAHEVVGFVRERKARHVAAGKGAAFTEASVLGDIVLWIRKNIKYDLSYISTLRGKRNVFDLGEAVAGPRKGICREMGILAAFLVEHLQAQGLIPADAQVYIVSGPGHAWAIVKTSNAIYVLDPAQQASAVRQGLKTHAGPLDSFYKYRDGAFRHRHPSDNIETSPTIELGPEALAEPPPTKVGSPTLNPRAEIKGLKNNPQFDKKTDLYRSNPANPGQHPNPIEWARNHHKPFIASLARSAFADLPPWVTPEALLKIHGMRTLAEKTRALNDLMTREPNSASSRRRPPNPDAVSLILRLGICGEAPEGAALLERPPVEAERPPPFVARQTNRGVDRLKGVSPEGTPDPKMASLPDDLLDAKPLEGEMVLDVGTGGGDLVTEMRRQGVDARGLDSHLQPELQSMHDVFYEAPADRLPFRDGSIGVLYSNWSVFFLPQLTGKACLPFLKEAARVVKTNGRIRLAAVNAKNLSVILENLAAYGLKLSPDLELRPTRPYDLDDQRPRNIAVFRRLRYQFYWKGKLWTGRPFLELVKASPAEQSVFNTPFLDNNVLARAHGKNPVALQFLEKHPLVFITLQHVIKTLEFRKLEDPANMPEGLRNQISLYEKSVAGGKIQVKSPMDVPSEQLDDYLQSHRDMVDFLMKKHNVNANDALMLADIILQSRGRTARFITFSGSLARKLEALRNSPSFRNDLDDLLLTFPHGFQHLFLPEPVLLK